MVLFNEHLAVIAWVGNKIIDNECEEGGGVDYDRGTKNVTNVDIWILINLSTIVKPFSMTLRDCKQLPHPLRIKESNKTFKGFWLFQSTNKVKLEDIGTR